MSQQLLNGLSGPTVITSPSSSDISAPSGQSRTEAVLLSLSWTVCLLLISTHASRVSMENVIPSEHQYVSGRAGAALLDVDDPLETGGGPGSRFLVWFKCGLWGSAEDTWCHVNSSWAVKVQVITADAATVSRDLTWNQHVALFRNQVISKILLFLFKKIICQKMSWQTTLPSAGTYSSTRRHRTKTPSLWPSWTASFFNCRHYSFYILQTPDKKSLSGFFWGTNLKTRTITTNDLLLLSIVNDLTPFWPHSANQSTTDHHYCCFIITSQPKTLFGERGRRRKYLFSKPETLDLLPGWILVS